MERVIAIICSVVMIQGLPINNGFSVKFNPLNTKEEIKQKAFGVLFAKIPQEQNSAAGRRRQFISKSFYPSPIDLGSGCTNQVAKVVFNSKNTEDSNEIEAERALNFINLPVLRRTSENYKVLLATAPPNVKINGDNESEPLVIYVVFPEEENAELSSINIPMIYFVNQQKGNTKIKGNGTIEPVLIINSNRTVTGLKSKEIEKFVKFKNKRISNYDYEI